MTPPIATAPRATAVPRTLTGLFARTAAAHGSRPALSDGSGRSLTYAQLDALSARAARRLRALGVGSEDRVGVHMRRGVDLFVAVLAVVRAGAAYVAVDDRYPQARRDLMLDAAGVRLTLSEPDRCGALPGRHRASAWPPRGTEDDGPDDDGPDDDGPDGGDGGVPLGAEALPDAGALLGAEGREAAAPLPSDAACVLFTSGSTGVPKGVVLEHGGVAGFAANAALPALEPADRVAQIANVSFDAVHFELWGAFAAGAELVVMRSLADLVHTDLRRELKRSRITAMLAPTMAVNHIAGEDPSAFSGLRVLHVGGDVVRADACRGILRGGFTGRLSNLYGPTEASTAATGYDLDDLAPDAAGVPIGRALDQVSVHLLDERLRPVPVGEPGVLHIGGAGVARGYLRDPRRTAERFLPDPFGAPGATMYATGDVARDRGDGVLEYLGRSDDQVKVRGYRVEPGEVERPLLRHAGVRDVAVLAVGEGQDCRLVAFVVPEDEDVAPAAVRAFAEAELPDYQVPAEFQMVEELPSTSHGKRDRAALLALLAERERGRSAYLAPRTDTERYLTGLWESLLGIERISAGDDFFQLGGHSMLAYRVRRRIEQDFAVRIPLEDILANTPLADLARLMDDLHATAEGGAR